LATEAKNIPEQERAIFAIKSVQTWRAVLRRAAAWKTARYTKGDIDATVVGIADDDNTVGYGYMPAMSIIGESAFSSESLIQTLLVPVIKDRSFVGIQTVLREVDQVLGVSFQTKFAIEEAIQLHFCSSLPDLFGGAEIGEFESLTNDPASGLVVENGTLRVPNIPGLGVMIDREKLTETTGSHKGNEND
jgi:hypothetical protein